MIGKLGGLLARDRHSEEIEAERPEPGVSGLELAVDNAPRDVSILKPSDFPPLSSRVAILHLPDANRRDAEDKARGVARDIFDTPSTCWFYVMPFGTGFAIEVQDGVGRPYLPHVVELLTNNPNASVAVPMSKRFLVLHVVRSNTFTSEFLPENTPPYAGSRIADRSDAGMTPVVATNAEWLVAGRLTAGSGLAMLVASLVWYAVDPAVVPPPSWRTTEYRQLPVLQEERSLSATGLDYLAKMEFKDGRWIFHRKPDPALAAAGIAPPPAVPVPGAQIPSPVMPLQSQGLAAAAPGLAGAQ